MKVNKKDLMSVLQVIKPGLAKKEMAEQATHFGFTGRDIVTFNDQICIIHPFKTDFSNSVPADQFYKILDKITVDEIEMVIKDDKLSISAGKVRGGLSIQDGKALLDRVEAVGVDEVKKWKTLPKDFLEAIGLCMFSASTDFSDPVMTGVFVDNDAVISTDSLRISEYILSKEMGETFNIPVSSIVELVKLSVVAYHIGKSWAYFITDDDVVFCAKLLDTSKYPKDIDEFFDIKGITFELPESFKAMIETASVMVEGDTEAEKLVEIEIKKDSISCKGSNDIGWIETELDIDLKIEKSIKFLINPSFLLKIMEHTRKMTYAAERGLFKTKNFQHLIALMPAEEVEEQKERKKKGKGKKKGTDE